MPALLCENRGIRVNGRSEHGIEVDFRKVHEIRIIAARHGVHRLVGESHRIEESIHAALEKVKERLFHRILLRTAQNAVFKDMEHARIIFRNGLECDREELVLIAVLHPCKPCTCLVVSHLNELSAALFCIAYIFYRKSVDMVIYIHVIASLS